MSALVHVCGGCPTPGRGFAAPHGLGTRRVLVVGDAAEPEDALRGVALRPDGPAGSVLERAIKRSGYTREELTLAAIVPCHRRITGAKVGIDRDVLTHCRQNLDDLVERIRPNVILALGDFACQELTGMAGEKRSVSMLRGYVLDSIRYSDVLVVPTFDPASLRRGGKTRNKETGAKTDSGAGKAGMHLFGVLCFDIQKSVEVARKGHIFTAPRYVERPSIDAARSFLDQVLRDRSAILTYDIETPESATSGEESLELIAREIIQIQFSLAPGTGICLPWEGEFIRVAKAILATDNPKAAHNGRKFDNPILRAAGANLGGVLHDTMEMWQRLQPDLPAGLQFVASFLSLPVPVEAPGRERARVLWLLRRRCSSVARAWAAAGAEGARSLAQLRAPCAPVLSDPRPDVRTRDSGQ